MHVRVRLLTGQTKDIEVDDNATIATLKDELSNEYVRETVKFVFKGTIISAETTALDTIGMSENDTLVLVGKKKSLEAAKREPQQATMASAFKASRNVGRNPASESAQAAPVPESIQESSPVPNEVVENIVSMGFDRALVLEALQKAHYNPELAVEFCLSGIPPGAMPSIEEPADSSQDPSTPTIARPEDLMHLQNLLAGRASQIQASETGLTHALRALPNFEQIRASALRNPPQLLPAIIDEIQQSYPDIHRLIQLSPEEFMQHIARGLPQPAANTIRVDPEPIQRLMNIGGFSQEEATRAYILANRNEDIAASILFEALEQGTMGGDSSG